MIRINKKKSITYIVAVVFAFRFIAKINPVWDNDGNMDLFYLFGILVFFKENPRQFYIDSFKYVSFFLVVTFSCFMFSKYSLVLTESVLTVGKIYICIILMLSVLYYGYEIKIDKFIDYVVNIYVVQTIVAYFMHNRIFWRVAEGRLELFYLEPGELSVHISFLILIEIFYLLYENYEYSKKRVVLNIIKLIILSVVTQGMSGILALFVALVVFLIAKIVFGKQNVSTFWMRIVMLAFFIAVFWIFTTDNVVSQRTLNVINGEDYSFTTRSTSNYSRLWSALEENNGIGVGFGNMDIVIPNSVLTAAYPTLFLEGGYLMIAITVVFNLYLVLLVFRRRSAEQLALLVFVNLYLSFGAYTSSPLVWIIYGIILCPMDKFLYYKREEVMLDAS